MGWLLLWTGIGLLWLAVLAGCCWRLWRKASALLRELGAQGRQLGELASLLGELEWQGDRDRAAAGQVPTVTPPAR